MVLSLTLTLKLTITNTNPSTKLIQILTIFSSVGVLLLSACQKISNLSALHLIRDELVEFMFFRFSCVDTCITASRTCG